MYVKYFIMFNMFLGCILLSQSNSTDNKILELTKLQREDKFVAGSNNWKGYSGCKNPDEKLAYSDNINLLIERIIQLIKNQKEKDYIKKIIDENQKAADELMENYKAETDECETFHKYIQRIKQIVFNENH